MARILESGIDALQVIEVKVQMDFLGLRSDSGDRLSFTGGRDVRKSYTNEKVDIERERVGKILEERKHFGCVLHSDDSLQD